MGRLVINGEEVYELDENCMKEKRGQSMTTGEKRRYTENSMIKHTFVEQSREISYAVSEGDVSMHSAVRIPKSCSHVKGLDQ